ncbi:MAG: HD domain-containing phosphohydrolase [Dictyoglomaceae bacterium]
MDLKKEVYNLILQTIGVAIIIIEEDTTISYCNREFENLSGYRREEIEGKKSWTEFVADEKELEKMKEYHRLRRISPELAPENYEFKFKDRYGNIKNIWLKVDVIPKTKKSIASFYDITELRKMLDNAPIALKELNFSKVKLYIEELKKKGIRNLKEYFENNKEEAIKCTKLVETTYINPYAIRLSFNKLLGEVPPQFIMEILTKLLEGKKSSEFTSIYSTPDGGSVIVEARWNIVPGYEENWEKIIVSLCDLTEMVKLQKEIENKLAKVQRVFDQMVNTLSTIVEIKDPYTAGHQKRVTELALAIAKEIGLSEDELRNLYIAGLLHDIGKIAIPSEILNKPGKLSQIEFDLIKSHPETGYKILKNIDFPWKIPEIVLQHHERLNGSGYPKGLKGDKILIEAKILAVADVVEAISSYRPYRPAFGIEVALEEINKNKGILYDPEVVDICIKLFREKGFKFQE